MILGLCLIAAGAATLLATRRADTYLNLVLPAFLLMGTGLGAASVASTASGTADVRSHGLASGLLNAAAQMGTVLGLAACTTLATTRTGLLAGYHSTFAATAVLAALTALYLATRRRTPPRDRHPAVPPATRGLSSR